MFTFQIVFEQSFIKVTFDRQVNIEHFRNNFVHSFQKVLIGHWDLGPQIKVVVVDVCSVMDKSISIFFYVD